jgi:hypothetical protein
MEPVSVKGTLYGINCKKTSSTTAAGRAAADAFRN